MSLFSGLQRLCSTTFTGATRSCSVQECLCSQIIKSKCLKKNNHNFILYIIFSRTDVHVLDLIYFKSHNMKVILNNTNTQCNERCLCLAPYQYTVLTLYALDVSPCMMHVKYDLPRRQSDFRCHRFLFLACSLPITFCMLTLATGHLISTSYPWLQTACYSMFSKHNPNVMRMHLQNAVEMATCGRG